MNFFVYFFFSNRPTNWIELSSQPVFDASDFWYRLYLVVWLVYWEMYCDNYWLSKCWPKCWSKICFFFFSPVIKTQWTLRTLVQWTCQCEILRTEDFTQKRFTLYHGYTMEMMLTRMTVHTVSAAVLDQQRVSS